MIVNLFSKDSSNKKEKNMKLSVLSLLSAKPVLQKISGYSLPIQSAYCIMKIIQKLNPEFEIIERIRLKIKLECCVLDESGRLISDEDGLLVFKPGISKEDYLSRNQALFDSEIEIEIEPFSLSFLTNVELSPLELLAISPFIVE